MDILKIIICEVITFVFHYIDFLIIKQKMSMIINKTASLAMNILVL